MSNNSIIYEQQFDDCDIPVTVEWEIEYAMGPSGVCILDKSVRQVLTWFSKVGFEARLIVPDLDGEEQVRRCCEPKLDMELVRNACARHWDTTGKFLGEAA